MRSMDVRVQLKAEHLHTLQTLPRNRYLFHCKPPAAAAERFAAGPTTDALQAGYVFEVPTARG